MKAKMAAFAFAALILVVSGCLQAEIVPPEVDGDLAFIKTTARQLATAHNYTGNYSSPDYYVCADFSEALAENLTAAGRGYNATVVNGYKYFNCSGKETEKFQPFDRNYMGHAWVRVQTPNFTVEIEATPSIDGSSRSHVIDENQFGTCYIEDRPGCYMDDDGAWHINELYWVQPGRQMPESFTCD
jgi:hypothetical protein